MVNLIYLILSVLFIHTIRPTSLHGFFRDFLGLFQGFFLSFFLFNLDVVAGCTVFLSDEGLKFWCWGERGVLSSASRPALSLSIWWCYRKCSAHKNLHTIFVAFLYYKIVNTDTKLSIVSIVSVCLFFVCVCHVFVTEVTHLNISAQWSQNFTKVSG